MALSNIAIRNVPGSLHIHVVPKLFRGWSGTRSRRERQVSYRPPVGSQSAERWVGYGSDPSVDGVLNKMMRERKDVKSLESFTKLMYDKDAE